MNASLKRFWQWLLRGAPVPQVYLAGAVVVSLIGLGIAGCGSSAREKALASQLNQAQTELTKSNEEIARVSQLNATLKTKYEWAAEKLAAGKANPFPTTVAACELYLAPKERGAFVFERSSANPAMLVASHPESLGVLELHEAPDGKVESAAVAVFYKPGMGTDEVLKRMKLVNDFLACVDPRIPNLDVHNLMTAQLNHMKDDISVHRKWNGVEAKCYSVKDLGLCGVTFAAAAD